MIEVVSAFGAFSIADTYTQAQADARYYPRTDADAKFQDLAQAQAIALYF